jgi:hypothetical protein
MIRSCRSSVEFGQLMDTAQTHFCAAEALHATGGRHPGGTVEPVALRGGDPQHGVTPMALSDSTATTHADHVTGDVPGVW